MITCNICGKTCRNTFAYVRHMQTHSCMTNVSFKCGFPECRRGFQPFAFTLIALNNTTKLDNAGDLTCYMDLRSSKCEDIWGLLLHLKSHITEGKTVTCPIRQCDKTFTVKPTFTSHVSRKHKACSEESLVDSIVSPSSTSNWNDECCATQLENPSQSSYSIQSNPTLFVKHFKTTKVDQSAVQKNK